MRRTKKNVSQRLCAVVLSFLMVFAMIPFSAIVPYAATVSHPDAVTVTVLDDVTGEPVANANVNYVIFDNDAGNELTGNNKASTDANGEAVIFEGSEPGNLKISSISVTHNDYESYTNDAYNMPITSLNDNFTVRMTCTRITDVEISGKTLTYSGKKQELVSVKKAEGDKAEYYLNDAADPVYKIPCEENAGTYKVRVVIFREGKQPFEQTVTTVINPAAIEEFDIAPVANLKYNGDNQTLVSLTGNFAESDTVTWCVNGKCTDSKEIPAENAVGDYDVTLTVKRGKNYKDFVKTVSVKIGLGDIDLNGLEISPVNRVYNGEEQALLNVVVKENSDYTLWYSVGNKENWVDTIPTATNAGEYEVYVKATKENYADKNNTEFPVKVTISKAEQTLQFVNKIPAEVTVDKTTPINNVYDFSVAGENLSNNDVQYSLVDVSSDNIATISSAGQLTVANAGIITVKATRAGNENYQDVDIYATVIVKDIDNGLISFKKNTVDYVLEESGVVSKETAIKSNAKDNGSLSYSIDKTNVGLSINSITGEVIITDRKTLAKAMGNSGNQSLTVTVQKSVGTVTARERKWNGFMWVHKKVTKEVYPSASASYVISITYATAPEFETVCKITDPAANGWYNSENHAVVSSIDTEKYSIAIDSPVNFAGDIKILEQGTKVHYIYVKNKTTKQISAGIGINIKVDYENPQNLKVTYNSSAINNILKLITLGFYNPSVTLTFTAQDGTSGLDGLNWTYNRQANQSETNLATESGELKFVDGKAELKLTASEAKQYRGNISFEAYDKAGNVSCMTDDGNVFVVDTFKPTMQLKYTGNGPDISENNSIENYHYFNGEVNVQLIITEANFYSDCVVVSVLKDGESNSVNPTWDNSSVDVHIGTFTLSEDGDYVIKVTCTDKSGNKMDDYESQHIVVDTTAPVVKIFYDEEKQKTVFKVTERNFRAEDVEITGKSEDINKKPLKPLNFNAAELTDELEKAKWTNVIGENGEKTDIYVYEKDSYLNGNYNLIMNYKDIAGNAAEGFNSIFTIDHGKPSTPEIVYKTKPINTLLEKITFGFYNPSVEVEIISHDETSGVKYFNLEYTSSIEKTESFNEISAVQDGNDKSKFTAVKTLTASEAEQYRGYLSANAVDEFGNESDYKTDKGNIIVVDTIAPQITVNYTEADRTVQYIDGENKCKRAYYNNEVDFTIIVTEANFYPECVNLSVKRNGELVDKEITWVEGNETAGDNHIGKFTLSASEDHSDDGDYEIIIEYTDYSGNEMTTYKSDMITIDTMKPIIYVEYDNDNVVNKLTDGDSNEREYFGGTQTATITVNEHNFNSDEVIFTIAAKDITGKDLADKFTKSDWTVGETDDLHIIEIEYPGDANYSFDIDYTDIATNASDDYETDYFTVDKTAPENLSVKYSTSILDTVLESLTFGFYNAKMTVSLSAEDVTSEVHSFKYSYLNAAGVSNVNAELIDEAIQAAKIKYSNKNKTAESEFEIPKMVLGNDNQFNGTVEFTATDRSGNETDKHQETKRIVVDNIAPVAQVSFNEATNVVGDVSYYNGNITASVTIDEANFYKEDVNISVTKDDGEAIAVTPVWEDNSVDVHVGTFTLTEDGDYHVTVSYKDKSGNVMTTYTSNQLTIDTQIEAPTYTINGEPKTAAGGAYKGEAVVGFNFSDKNFDSQTITLTKTRFDNVEDVTNAFISVNSTENGGSGSFTIPSDVVENDGIYVLKITMTDRARHTAESEIKFTINRYGSVYEYSDDLLELISNGGQHVKAVDGDLVITEYNADRINEGSLNILITRDGETVDTDFISNPSDINAQTEIGESGWYQYTYTIKADNFKEDGVYKISLTSTYDTDDEKDNESASVPENSITEAGEEVLDTMSFTVDSVAPEIRNVVNLDKGIADMDKIVDGKLNVKYTIVDVGGIKTIEIIVNGITIQTLNEEDIAGDAYNFTGSFDLEEQDGTKAHKVQIIVTDLAGNVSDTNSEEFLKSHAYDNENSTYVFLNEVTVSRNFFVRWYANTALFWGSIAGVIVLAAGILLIIAYKRKKKEEKNK